MTNFITFRRTELSSVIITVIMVILKFFCKTDDVLVGINYYIEVQVLNLL